MSGSKKRKRTSHQCGEDMTCNLCHAPYPWPDLECPLSTEDRRNMAAQVRREERERALRRMAEHFAFRVVGA